MKHVRMIELIELKRTIIGIGSLSFNVTTFKDKLQEEKEAEQEVVGGERELP